MQNFLHTQFLNIETAAYHGLFQFGFSYMFGVRYFARLGLQPFIYNSLTSTVMNKGGRTQIKLLGSNLFSECGNSRFSLLLAKIGARPASSLDSFSLILPFSQFVKIEHSDAFIKQQSIKNNILISSYRGMRHNTNLPIRGQRTHTNAKTRRKRKII